MPSTNLPDPDAHKGSAGFKYQPGGSTSVAEAVHTLNWPAELVPQGGASYRTNKMRRSVDAADLSRRETFTLGEGREEATLRLRFDDWPDSLMDMLEDAADGVELDYYPRLASTNLFFPVHLLDAEGRISEDSDRFAHAEYEADLTLRDASTDAQGFGWLKGPNKLKGPRMARGTTDGVAEDWTLASGGAGNASIEDRAQKLALSSTEATRIEARQDTDGALSGDTWKLSADVRAASLAGAAARVRLEERTSTGAVQSWATTFTSTGFGRVTVTSTAFTTGTQVRASMRVVDTTTGSSGTGTAWFRDARLTLE